MGTARPIKVAVLGSGPSGIYATSSLLNQDAFDVVVDVFDRLPTPYGLVRYGVAPDHPNIKSVVNTLQKVLESPGVRFFGCVDFGVDVSRDDLVRHYDAVIYATGASVDRALGVPGEQLPGSHPATEFVAWYSGHPDAACPIDLAATTSVVVVGVGNVALDVARILAKTPEDLAQTDAPTPVLDVLRGSTVRDIHLIGRRGPEYAKFTTKELRELGELVNATVHVRAHEIVVDPALELPRGARSNVAVLDGWVGLEQEAKPREVHLRFSLRPVEILGTDHVEGMRCQRTQVVDGAVVGTGEFETIRADVVLRAVGYRSLPLPGVPFDAGLGVVANAAGRVIGADGAALPDEYVAGWLKRGPTGVIGTNKSDAAETVRNLVEDFQAAGIAERPPQPEFDAELAARGLTPVDWQGWLRIDAEELARGPAEARPRSKISDWETLRRLGGQA